MASLSRFFLLALLAIPAAAQTPPMQTQSVGGIILLSPLPLVEAGRQVRSAATPKEIPFQEAVAYKAKVNGLEIAVGSIEYVPGTPPDLNNVTASAVKALVNTPGIVEPKSDLQNVTVSGVPAKKLIFSASRGDVSFCIEALYIVRGQHLWTIQTIFPHSSPGTLSMAESILASVKLTEK